MRKSITSITPCDRQNDSTDLKECLCLSDEEIQALVASVTASEMYARTERAMHIRKLLIEGHLWIAFRHARACCPPVFSHSHFPDLLASAYLALVEAMERYEWEQKRNLTVYLYVSVKWAVRQAFAENFPIRTTHWARVQAGKTGTLKDLDRLQPLSLDRVLDVYGEHDEWHPLFSMSEEGDDEQEAEKRARLDTLLSYLSERAQTILRLRYGLCYQDDERSAV